jgi:hypothetical protein
MQEGLPRIAYITVVSYNTDFHQEMLVRWNIAGNRFLSLAVVNVLDTRISVLWEQRATELHIVTASSIAAFVRSGNL